mgnify:CR=1 FL=1
MLFFGTFFSSQKKKKKWYEDNELRATLLNNYHSLNP